MGERLESCTRCHAYVFLSTHACILATPKGQPKWKAWCPDDGETEDDAGTVRACDAEEAAETHVANFDTDSLEQLTREGFSVCVRDGEAVRRFRVRGEATINYRTEEE